MNRLTITPRREWHAIVEAQGLTYHLHETGTPYWNESAAYELTGAEIVLVERRMKELHHLLIDVADGVVTRGDWDLLGIPEWAIPAVEQSWEADQFSLYGRFDLAWMPGREPKLLEYNADTPTSLVEAAVCQWYWLKDYSPHADQLNSIHERLVDAWRRFGALNDGLKLIDFTSVSANREDEQTISYLIDTCQQAGFQTRWSAIGDVGWSEEDSAFITSEGIYGSEPIAACFKLYPWEWMFNEAYGRAGCLTRSPTVWIEPPWKALLSNKAILALAHQAHPNHPNLLRCTFDAAKAGRDYVCKPKLSREGANVTVVMGGREVLATGGEYGEEGFVYQELADIPDFDGNRPVFGGWIVDHEAAGLGVRESNGLVTDNLSRFVPHFYTP